MARDTTPAERCRGARARRSHPPSGAARVRSPSTPSTPDALVLGPQHAESAREVAAAVARAARGSGTSSPCGSSVGLGLLHRIAPARHTQSRTTAQRLNRPQAALGSGGGGRQPRDQCGRPTPRRARHLGATPCASRAGFCHAQPHPHAHARPDRGEVRRAGQPKPRTRAQLAPLPTVLRRRLDRQRACRLRTARCLPLPKLICAAGSTGDNAATARRLLGQRTPPLLLPRADLRRRLD